MKSEVFKGPWQPIVPELDDVPRGVPRVKGVQTLAIRREVRLGGSVGTVEIRFMGGQGDSTDRCYAVITKPLIPDQGEMPKEVARFCYLRKALRHGNRRIDEIAALYAPNRSINMAPAVAHPGMDLEIDREGFLGMTRGPDSYLRSNEAKACGHNDDAEREAFFRGTEARSPTSAEERIIKGVVSTVWSFTGDVEEIVFLPETSRVIITVDELPADIALFHYLDVPAEMVINAGTPHAWAAWEAWQSGKGVRLMSVQINPVRQNFRLEFIIVAKVDVIPLSEGMKDINFVMTWRDRP